MFGRNIISQTPPVVKNLIAINVLFFLAQGVFPVVGYLGLYHWEMPQFEPYQLVTHMFLHGSLSHLFFNMFALWMFGRILEYDLGSKRFLIYYVVTGIGAALIHMLVFTLMGGGVSVTVGASGAVFGVLLAFGMLHPNDMIMLLIPPIPMKAKYFVIGYGALELILGFVNSGGSIAHFAHVGGMLWGYMLLRWWKNKGVL